MAEVFRGEATSVQGFKKSVAIKRVLPHLAQKPKFISMFLDEARLGARLNQANIVSVLDIGATDNTYFIVMEYVDGGSLKAITENLAKLGHRMELKDAIYICMEACRGLSYAHEALDENGRPLAIVHRDVSPPNILVSRRGEVKLTDFGLAKATTQLESTDPGVVKGKFSYLSPEAASGLDVDHRADLFSLGIVLWELLAGGRLFLGESDYQTVKMVEAAKVPSLVGVHPEVDQAFDAILQKSLARDRQKRYQTAREFGDSLADYLFRHQMKVTSYDVANFVRDVLPAQRDVSRPDQTIIDRLIQEELDVLKPIGSTITTGPLDPLMPSVLPGAAPLDVSKFSEALGSGAARLSTGMSLPAGIAPTAGGLATVLEGEGFAELSTQSATIDAKKNQARAAAAARFPWVYVAVGVVFFGVGVIGAALYYYLS